MIFRYTILSLLFTLTAVIGFGQKNLLRFLQADTAYTVIKGIDVQNKLITLPQELNCETSRHHYIVRKGQLFIQVDGSGKLFQVDSSTLAPIRLDKTCYEGYNFLAYNFNWKDRFYSVGGWGFWKYDGGIRYFEEASREWSIIPTNRRVPVAQVINSLGWLDKVDEKYYMIYSKDDDLYLKNHEKDHDSIFVQCLDLKRMTWWDEPKYLIADNPLITGNTFRKIIPTSMGLLVEAWNKFQLFDFKDNKVYTLPDNKGAAIAALTTRTHHGFFIQRNQDLYIYDPLKDSVSPLIISKKDFLKKTQPMYTTQRATLVRDRWMISLLIIIGGLVILISTLLYKYRKLLKSSKGVIIQENQGEPIQFNRSLSFEENLTSQELAVFELLIDNSSNNKLTSIDEINRVLGTKNKDIAVQKNIRSEVLQSLNERFQIYSTTSDLLVERERAEFDKRIYLYKINCNSQDLI